MKQEMKENIIEEGVSVLYREMGPSKAIKFFQLVGINRGDTLKEIEAITQRLSREQSLRLVRKERIEA